MKTPDSPASPPAVLDPRACWNEIGGQGNGTCPKLAEVIRCRNCPVFSAAARQLLDRPLTPDYRRAWTEHFAQAQTPAAPASMAVLLFRLQAEWLALPAQVFQEVAERRPVHSLPHRRQGIVLGLVNVRGELLLCVSLARLLRRDEPPQPEARQAAYDRLLVANWAGQRYAFPADEVRGIQKFQAAELTEPPATLAKSGLAYTRGLLPWQGRVVGLLDAERVFSSLNRSLT